MSAIVAYIPVLHEGYRRFFEKHPEAQTLYILGSEFIQADRALARDIRQLDPVIMQRAIAGLGLFERVLVLDNDAVHALNATGNELILPDEDISRAMAETHFQNAHCTFDSIFLCWDKHNALAEKPVVPDEEITQDEFHRHVLGVAETEAQKSSDNWRHVGGAIVKDGEIILLAHNAHKPSPHTPYVHGDPRNNFKRGEHIELSTAEHAEVSLIAEAAKRGLALEGTDMYVTVFPCPPCAKAIAHAGIKTLYCGGGYAVLDGAEILKSAGVKIMFVE